MFVPPSNVPVTLWATMSFKAIVNFDGPSPVLTVEPLPGRSSGVEFLGTTDFIPNFLVLVNYRLLVPVALAERLPTSGIELSEVGSTAPLVPITPSVTPSGPDAEFKFDQLILATEAPPPQGSPPREMTYNIALYRAVPVSDESE